MLRRLSLISALVVGIGVILVTSPAGATVTPGCSGSATLSSAGKDFGIDASDSGTVKIPRQAEVQYRGSIDLAEGREYSHSGSAVLKVFFTEVKISSWEWGGETQKVATDGSTSYDLDLPAGVLGGVKGNVSGTHTQGGKTCTAKVLVEIDGSPVNAGSIASAVGTLAAGAGLLAAARGKLI